MSTVDTSNYTATPLSEIAKDLNAIRYDPTAMIRSAIETVEKITDGEAVLMDPTHPAVTFLEMSACMASNSVQETVSALRLQYPILAETTDDLYRHMADADFLNRFASASRTRITFGFLLQDIQYKMVYDKVEKASKAIIPRDTRFTVDGVTFTLLYPVVIRRYDTGAIQITYDSEIASPLRSLKGTVITPAIRKSPKMDEWLFFAVDALQVDYKSERYVIEKSYFFQKTITFEDQFYHARAFIKNDATGGNWVEVATTHSDQIFNSERITVLLKVSEGFLTAEVPVVYFSNNMISGELKIVVYTTKGNIVMNLRNYQSTDFTVNPTPIDEERDVSDYSNVLARVSYYVYGQERTMGGKNELSFEELMSRVVYHTVGPQDLPITDVQLITAGENNSFDIVPRVNVLTKRQLLATRRLPSPTNPKLITAANIGILTYAELLSTIMENENVISHGTRYTILSNTVFQNVNGRVTMLTKNDTDAIRALTRTALVNKVNNSEYHYTPFHYVLDDSGLEFDLRAYMLDQPYAQDLSFERQNQTIQLFVNTGRYQLEKKNYGYLLRIETNSGDFYKAIPDASVGVQLAITPANETTRAYINGDYVGRTEAQERIFEFRIETNYEVNSSNFIALLNAQVQGVTDYKCWSTLETQVDLLHYTNDVPSTFVKDETDALLGKFLLTPFMMGNSHETLTLHFGDALENLWRRTHSYKTDKVYKTYETDIPAFWPEDVFDPHPDGTVFDIVNGELVYRYLHRAGEPILDEFGNQELLHRKGDPVLVGGVPVEISQISTGREMDILVVDGRYWFADDEATVEYRDELAGVVAGWIVGDIAEIKSNLLEQTEIFFYPKTTLGEVKIRIEDNAETYTSAEQRFTVNLYVKSAIFNDEKIKDRLRKATISLLDKYIANRVVNMTEVKAMLRSLYGESVTAFTISGLGGSSNNFEVVTMRDEEKRLCLKKELTILANMKMFVKDAVEIEFKRIDASNLTE